MGDVGDYWREHREYKRRKRLGITRAEEVRLERERAKEKKAAHYARCTIQCECGKWLLDTAAHNCHKNRWGKKGHSVVANKAATDEGLPEGFAYATSSELFQELGASKPEAEKIERELNATMRRTDMKVVPHANKTEGE